MWAVNGSGSDETCLGITVYGGTSAYALFRNIGNVYLVIWPDYEAADVERYILTANFNSAGTDMSHDIMDTYLRSR